MSPDPSSGPLFEMAAYSVDKSPNLLPCGFLHARVIFGPSVYEGESGGGFLHHTKLS